MTKRVENSQQLKSGKRLKVTIIFALLTALVLWRYYSSLSLTGSTKGKPVDAKYPIAVTRHSKTISTKETHTACAPREGLIVLNTLGLLANNLFEVSFANRLAQELCWKVVYRPFWNNVLPSKRGSECFPQASMKENPTEFTNISTELQQIIRMNSTRWIRMTPRRHAKPAQNEVYSAWVKDLTKEGLAVSIEHGVSDFTGKTVDVLVDRIRNETSSIRLVSLQAFFIHYDWMREWTNEIREWLTMDPSCCLHIPPDNAIVVHVRDFAPTDTGHNDMQPSVYSSILQKYYYNYDSHNTNNNNNNNNNTIYNNQHINERPLWIVCQPKTVNSTFVRELMAVPPSKNATIVTGQDQFDAFCTLTKAKTLLLSSVSTFSQLAAVVAGSETDVHYPLDTLDRPKVTMSVPGWKYHLVKADSLDSVVEFDVDHDRLVSGQA